MKTVACILTLTVLAGCSGDDAPSSVGELTSDRIELVADSTEPIVEILVDEGATVTAGQALLRQDPARATARLAAADAAVREADARLDEMVRGPREERIRALRAALDGANRERDFRSNELRRIRDIHTRGLASADALDAATAARDAANASFRQRQAELEELLTGTTAEELAQAEQAVARARAERDLAAIDLERLTLLAPQAGILDTRLYDIGERPAIGQPVLILLGGERPYARVYVPESLRSGVTPGTRARVRVDGVETPLDGIVRWISSDPAFTPYYALTEHDRGRLSYVAKIDLEAQASRLPDGVPVVAEFSID